MRAGTRVDRKKKGLTKTRDGWRNHRKTVWAGKVGDRHGGCDQQDKSRLQAGRREARWNVFEQMVLKEPQSCRNGLSHHREEDRRQGLTARESSWSVQNCCAVERNILADISF